MEGLVHILLGHGDIVFKPARNRGVHLMDHTQRRIAVLYRIHNNPHGKQVVNLVQRLLLVHHFLVNAEKMFRPAVNLGFNPRGLNMAFHIFHDVLHKSLALPLFQGNFFHQVIVDLRFQILQRQVIQFHLDLGNTKPLGDGRIDVHGFPGFFLLFRRRPVFGGPHIVKPVCQLYQYNPDILGHGQKHFSEILCLYLHLVRRIVQLAQLGHAVHNQFHFFAELFLQFFRRHDGIFHHIVEQAGHNGLFVQFQVRQNNRHTEGMNDIGLSGFSFLVLMSLESYPVSLFDHGEIIRGMIFHHTGNQFLVQFLRAGKVLHGFYAGVRFFDFLNLFLVLLFRNRHTLFTVSTFPPCHCGVPAFFPQLLLFTVLLQT